MVTNNKPHDLDSLANELSRPRKTVEMAINTFIELNMFEIIDGLYYIKNWEKYQAVEKMNEIREYNRIKQQEYRARVKAECQ